MCEHTENRLPTGPKPRRRATPHSTFDPNRITLDGNADPISTAAEACPSGGLTQAAKLGRGSPFANVDIE
jgi:hypothetical protein